MKKSADTANCGSNFFNEEHYTTVIIFTFEFDIILC